MTYSIIGILAAIILLVINRDVLWAPADAAVTPTQKLYRHFLLGVEAYYITDALWGVLAAQRLTALLFVDTTVHFIAMVAALMLWTRYVVVYLESDNIFGRILIQAGRLFLFFELLVLLISVQVFYPLLPLYAIGYMLGTCLLHSFVVEDEKEDYRRELEKALERERLQKEALTESREALKDALATAEQANRAKTAFLSNMSHEIRTPMNAIIALTANAFDEDVQRSMQAGLNAHLSKPVDPASLFETLESLIV